MIIGIWGCHGGCAFLVCFEGRVVYGDPKAAIAEDKAVKSVGGTRSRNKGADRQRLFYRCKNCGRERGD